MRHKILYHGKYGSIDLYGDLQFSAYTQSASVTMPKYLVVNFAFFCISIAIGKRLGA